MTDEKLKGVMSHKSDDWKTPSKIYNYYMKNGYIDCFKYKSTEDEFKNNYYNKKLYVNPPYSKLKEVAEWVMKQYDHGNDIILLIPARTDTSYFHKLLILRPRIQFIKGRLHFNDSKLGAPFPSIILDFNQKYEGDYDSVCWEI